MNTASIEKSHGLARKRHAEMGRDTDRGLRRLVRVPVSRRCWQGMTSAGLSRAGDSTGRLAEVRRDEKDLLAARVERVANRD